MLKYLYKSIAIGLLLLVLSGCSLGNIDTPTTSQSGNSATSGLPVSSPTPASTTTGANPLHITNVSVSINPTTLVGVSCGSATDITFTATLYANFGSDGGQVAYTWTINGANTPGTVTFDANDASKTVNYTLSGASTKYGILPKEERNKQERGILDDSKSKRIDEGRSYHDRTAGACTNVASLESDES